MSSTKLHPQVAFQRNSRASRYARKQPELLPWRVGMIVGVMGHNVPGFLHKLTEDARSLGLSLLRAVDNGTDVYSTSRFVLDLRKLATSMRTAVLVDLRATDPARIAAMAGTNRRSSGLVNGADVLDFVLADFASCSYLVSGDGGVISLAHLTLPLPEAGALNAQIDLEVQHRLECIESEADASEKGGPR